MANKAIIYTMTMISDFQVAAFLVFFRCPEMFALFLAFAVANQ